MTLSPGTRLGPLEVIAAIGAGGMGEVFRARDTTLNRDVAIKVLPQAMAGDPERLARFKREAQVLASLSHSNIAHVHGFEAATLPDGSTVHCLTMEMVEGQDLAERLRRGAIPIDEALAVAKQIAEGVEDAHDHGIIHRDLKPANVKVTPNGKVKILDFGLARAFEGDPSPPSADSEPPRSPTRSRPMTEAGTIMGTAAYMSPEQARGRVVDKRADIWSFGVVLFEMLTGARLFAGETASDTLVAVLQGDIPWSTLPAQTPRVVVQLLRRCLARDPHQRLRDIGEARMALSDPLDSSALPASPAFAPAATGLRGPARWTALSLLVMTSAVAGGWAWTRLRPVVPSPATRLTIPMPKGQVLTGNSGPAITRDGRTIAYVARDASGVARLYLRGLDRFESTAVPESEGAQQPFFSPTGDRVGFFARGKLMTALVAGGAPTVIADGSYLTFGGTWGEDDTIVFVPTLMAGLLRIPSSGGKAERLTQPDGASKGYGHAFPQYLPGGRGIVFTVWGGVDSEAPGIAYLPGDSSTWSTVTGSRWRGAYAASGHLLLGGPRNITAIPFEPGQPPSKGPPTLVVEDVFGSLNQVNSWFATSPAGTLVYVPGDAILGQLAWVDRGGNVTKIETEPGRLADPILSPDGSKVLFVQDTTLWIMELRRGTRTRLTFDRDGENRFAAWSRDGETVYFASNRSGEWKIYSMPAAGGPAKLLLNRPGVQFPVSSAPDGRLLFVDRPAGTSSDLYLLSAKGEVTPLVVSPFSKVAAQFSPDGEAVAYVSDDTGSDEVYVRSVVHPDEVVTVSTNGGRGPKWSPDGKELFYRRGDAFLAATITTARGQLSVGDSKRLFELQAASGTSTQQAGYSVSPDGRRFLVQLPDARAIPTQINVVLNWFEELKAKVPAR